MRIDSLLRGLAPLAALVMGATVSGCDGEIAINGEEGKPLSELDLTGPAPTKLVLAGPDRVELNEGAKLAIIVDPASPGAADLRFSLKDGTLGILRRKGWKGGDPVLIRVTMPAPSDITIAGSGSVVAKSMAPGGRITIAGSGDLDAGTISGDSAKILVAGSGNLKAGGAVKELDLTLAGTGGADLATLRSDAAKVTIAGSGSAGFQSDGTVKATIMGSGRVTVKGRATCTVSSMGSGKLVCENGTTAEEG